MLFRESNMLLGVQYLGYITCHALKRLMHGQITNYLNLLALDVRTVGAYYVLQGIIIQMDLIRELIDVDKEIRRRFQYPDRRLHVANRHCVFNVSHSPIHHCTLRSIPP